jgi:hypothetical protein
MLTPPTPPRLAAIRRPAALLVLLGGSLVWADEAAPETEPGEDHETVPVLVVARPAAPGTEPNHPLPDSAVRRRITELLVQAAKQTAVTPSGAVPPKLDPPASEPPVAEGVLELETVRVTTKKPLELPLRLKPVTLENFFYGDGKIFESANGRFSISAGGAGSGGAAAIKFTLQF